MTDLVTREEMEQAGRIVVSRLDLEGQVAFSIFIRWFTEQIEILHTLMTAAKEMNR